MEASLDARLAEFVKAENRVLSRYVRNVKSDEQSDRQMERQEDIFPTPPPPSPTNLRSLPRYFYRTL